MTDQDAAAAGTLTSRERRWLNALLVLGTLTVGLLFLGLFANVLIFFSDILLIFFLAWLLAFILSPTVARLDQDFPRLPRSVVVVITYLLLLVALLLVALLVASALATSLGGFVTSIPTFQTRLPEVLAPIQQRLNDIGLNVDLLASSRTLLGGLGDLGRDLVRPLSEIALASIGAFSNLLLIVVLSLFIVMDGDRITAFINRLIPQKYSDEFQLLQQSVSSAFGGFLRGQAVMGLAYGVVAAATHLLLGLEYGFASAAISGLLMMIPFFGPVVAWMPPVLVALLTKGDVTLIAFAIMMGGSFLLLNAVAPRLMAAAVGVHPIVVLASLLLGLKFAGVAGAIFGIPIAAVISSFFFYYLNRNTAARDVASRAAKRLEARHGRPVRVPVPPSVGDGLAAGPLPGAPGSTEPAPSLPSAAPAASSKPAGATGTVPTVGPAGTGEVHRP